MYVREERGGKQSGCYTLPGYLNVLYCTVVRMVFFLRFSTSGVLFSEISFQRDQKAVKNNAGFGQSIRGKKQKYSLYAVLLWELSQKDKYVSL